MNVATRRTSLMAAAVIGLLSISILAQRPPTPADTTARIVAAAQAVSASLDDAGRAKLQFTFNSPQKAKWSNFPNGIYPRNGVRLGDLTPPQRNVVMKLLTVALSADGFRKITDIMHGDETLKRNPAAGAPPAGPGRGGPPPGGNAGGRGPGPGGRGPGGPGGPGGGGPGFGEDNYFLAFVGTPSTATPWMLQYGGHHLAINLTIAGSQASMTPSLPAAQPATFEWEGRTVRPLGKENDQAFTLINALDATQRSQAILGFKVADLVLGPGQDGKTIQPEGIKASALSVAQQTMLWDIVREWSGIMAAGYAEPRMTELKSHLNDTYFAWSGATTAGAAAYFRIQGPTLVIEYSPQDSVDHIHTIYRDPTNDYGSKIAKQ